MRKVVDNTLQPPSPEFLAIQGRLRSRLVLAIDRLIATLDAIDGDAEAEPDELTGELEAEDREPSLGSLNGINQAANQGSADDIEAEHDGREPDEDLEPSLGWTTGGCSWAAPGYDLEDEHNGMEAECVEPLPTPRPRGRGNVAAVHDAVAEALGLIRDGQGATIRARKVRT